MATEQKKSSRDSTLKQVSQKIANGGFIFRGRFIQNRRDQGHGAISEAAIGR